MLHTYTPLFPSFLAQQKTVKKKNQTSFSFFLRDFFAFLVESLAFPPPSSLSLRLSAQPPKILLAFPQPQPPPAWLFIALSLSLLFPLLFGFLLTDLPRHRPSNGFRRLEEEASLKILLYTRLLTRLCHLRESSPSLSLFPPATTTTTSL